MLLQAQWVDFSHSAQIETGMTSQQQQPNNQQNQPPAAAAAAAAEQAQEVVQPEWNAEECDRFSFDDSDRFEEDSLCSWSSEPESLCNNWRGWKRPTTTSNFGIGGPRKHDGKFFICNFLRLFTEVARESAYVYCIPNNQTSEINFSFN